MKCVPGGTALGPLGLDTRSCYTCLHNVFCSGQGFFSSALFRTGKCWQRQLPLASPHLCITYIGSRSFLAEGVGVVSGSSSEFASRCVLPNSELVARSLHLFEHLGHLQFQLACPPATASLSIVGSYSCLFALRTHCAYIGSICTVTVTDQSSTPP